MNTLIEMDSWVIANQIKVEEQRLTPYAHYEIEKVHAKAQEIHDAVGNEISMETKLLLSTRGFRVIKNNQ